MDLFHAEHFQEVFDTIRELRPLTDLELNDDDITFNIPVDRPSKVICLGLNYAGHAKEGGQKPPKEPIIFPKASSCLAHHQATILMPGDVGRVDHEAELAIVIGKTGSKISESEANDYIAGYTLLNDVTARAMQKEDIASGKPWFRSKSLDTFGPVGPFLVPRSLIKDPHNLDMTLTVNGEIRQKTNTGNMIFSIPEVISYISKFMTLNPGDIISTGTPEGISELHDGDICELTIPEIGTLRNFAFSAPPLFK
ncbi:fumarylacetoacetate hydrolase family protein [bacterium]|nr:fumarylacetoacetate hydrolase family protein [bacterium]